MDPSASSTVTVIGGRPTGFTEEINLKFENERRLQEMREQGKQCMMDREDTSSREDGAANLLARFHSLHWMRQPHAEVPAGTAHNVRSIDKSHMNLVPMKHGEEEYFPGTRQQKKPRRSKNARPKCEAVRLEETVVGPKELIPPAGYHAPPTNAWSLRKGSELFDSRKVSLILYSPSDKPDEVYERAVQESLVTVAEEQDRIVNMCSNQKMERDFFEGTDAAKFVNETIDMWDAKDVRSGGGGDANWLPAGCQRVKLNGYQPSVEEKLRAEKIFGSENSSVCFSDLPNSSYSTLKRICQPDEGLNRSVNDMRVADETNKKVGRENLQCGESADVLIANEARQQTRFDAGDNLYNEKFIISQTENQGYKPYLKEQYEDAQNKNSFNKSRYGKYNLGGFKKKEDKKETELERLGFNKARTDDAHREMSRRSLRDPYQKRGSMQARAGNYVEQEKQRSTGQSTTNAGEQYHGRDNTASQEHYTRFSDRAVKPPAKHDRLNNPSLEHDEDSWLEPEERNKVVPKVSFSSEANTQPEPNDPKPVMFSSPNREEYCVQTKSENILPKKQSSPERNMVRTTPNKSEIGEATEVNSLGNSEKLNLPTRDSATSPGVASPPGFDPVSFIEEPVFNHSPTAVQKMKKIHEEIDYLNNRLKMLSTAIEGCDEPAQMRNLIPKTETEALAREVVPAEKTEPSAMEDETNKSQDVPPVSTWFQMLANQMAHQLVHPMLSVIHPVTQSLPHSQNVAMLHPEVQKKDIQVPAEVPVQINPKIHLVHHQTNNHGLPQVQSQVPQAVQQVLVQEQVQFHPAKHQPHLQPHILQGNLEVQHHLPVQQEPTAQQQPQQQPEQQQHMQQPQQQMQQRQQQMQQPQQQMQQPQQQMQQPQQQMQQPQHVPFPLGSQQQLAMQQIPSGYPEALMAHLQQMQQGLVTNHEGHEMQVQVAQNLAEQQRILAMHGATAAVNTPGVLPNVIPVNWLGVLPCHPTHPPANWGSQMTSPSGAVTEENVHQMGISATQPFTSNVDPSGANHMNGGTGETGGISNQPFTSEDFPHSVGPTVANPVATSVNAASGREMPADGTIPNQFYLVNGAPDVQNNVAYMQWLAQMTAYHRLHQQQMIQVAQGMPGINLPIPVQNFIPAVVPSFLNAAAPEWLPSTPSEKIPPNYEGDWIISPDDEARLGQGIPLVPIENHDHMISSLGRQEAHGGNFQGLSVPATLKPARLPAHLVYLKQHNVDAQVPDDSDTLDLSAFNPAVPPPKVCWQDREFC